MNWAFAHLYCTIEMKKGTCRIVAVGIDDYLIREKFNNRYALCNSVLGWNFQQIQHSFQLLLVSSSHVTALNSDVQNRCLRITGQITPLICGR